MAFPKSQVDRLGECPLRTPSGKFWPLGLTMIFLIEFGRSAHRLVRFERFSDDFSVWVAFYGPEGGEAR